MKRLHRGKAIVAYQGARLTIKEGLTYPSYLLLKEALRGTLAYINEDRQGKTYSDKTKLRTLIEEAPINLTQDVDISAFDILLELEKKGLESMMAIDIKELDKVRRALKKVIGLYLGERL